MRFDISTAKPVQKSGFDLSTAKPVQAEGKSLMTQAEEYPSQTARPDLKTLPEQVGSLINPMPFAPTLSNPIPNIPAEFEKKRALAEQAGRTARDVLQKGVGDVVSNTSALASKYLPKSIANILNPIIATSGGVVGTALNVVPMTPTENTMLHAPGMMIDDVVQGTKGMSESMANRGTPTPKAIRESRLEKGQPTVGEDRLSLPKDQVGDLATNNPKTTFNTAKVAIENLNQKIKGKINELFAKGITPNQPDVKAGGTPQLEYKPSEVQTVPVRSFGSDRTIATPNIEKTYIPERTIPFNGTRPTPGQVEVTYPGEVYQKDQFGIPVRQPQDITKSIPVDIHNPTEPAGLYPQTKLGGYTAETPVGSLTPTVETPPLKTAAAETSRSLKEPQRYPFTGIKQGPNLPKQEIADSIDSFAQTLDAPDAEALMKYKEGWLKGKPDNLDFKTLNQERIKLGEDIGKGFDKLSPELSNKATAQRMMWMKIRDYMGQQSPELDEMLELQHKLIDIKNSVKPEAALGYSKHGMLDYIKSPIESTQRNIGLADTLQNTLPSAPVKRLATAGAVAPTKIIPSIADQVDRLKR